MSGPKMNVEGTQQVEAALSEVAKGIQDLSGAHKAEAQMLSGDVQRFTRYQTGALQAGWEWSGEPEAARFTNRVSYAGVQEFGYRPRNIEPTLAVEKAFTANASQTEQIYNDAIKAIADGANIETRG